MFKIRLADSDDIKKVFELSNDMVVRENSINQNPIKWDEHVKWFNETIQSQNVLFYIIETCDSQFIGQVRIKKGEENVISISISEKFRGKGLASKILQESALMSGLENLTAYIKKENNPSLKSFLNAGYEISNIVSINNLEFYKLNCKID